MFNHIGREVMLRISEGDESAFAVFFNHYYVRLRPFVARFFNDSARAEEALQETFIRVWLHRDKLPEIDNTNAWVYTICSRVCLTEMRRDLSRRRGLQELRLADDPSSVMPVDTPHLADISRLINEAVARMPAARRRIFLMSREEGLKPAAIAQKLSLSVNTVRNTLVAALKNIREHLEESGHLISLFFLWIIFL